VRRLEASRFDNLGPSRARRWARHRSRPAQIPAEQPTSVSLDSSAADADEIAKGFLDAYAAYDADRAMTYLTDDAVLTDAGGVEVFESPKAMRLALDFFEAQPYKQMILDCEQQDETAVGISVRCPFKFHAIRSDEIGLGPYGDNYWELTVRDGKIVSAETNLADNGFSQEMWEPFAQWVSAEYPEDAAVMYTDRSHTGARISEESIQLWGQRSREYTQAVLTGPETYAADVDAICATQAAQLGELAVPAEGALDQIAAWNAASAAIIEQAHRELIALDRPPGSNTMPYTSFYAQLIRLVRLAEESAEAATAGDSTRLADLDAEYLEVRQAMSSGPAGSGLEECLESLPS
jgi:hypothetical protein